MVTTPKPAAREADKPEPQGKSVGGLMWIKFRRNPLAKIGIVILAILYFLCLLCEFFSPHTTADVYEEAMDHPPTTLHFVDSKGKFHLRPFVYGYDRVVDYKKYKVSWVVNTEKVYPIYFFINKGRKYPVLGFLPIKINLRFFNTKEGNVFLFGTDKWGRDTFSRVLYGGRISLSIGWVGVFISLILGMIFGGLSGYFSGIFDLIFQRIIEVIGAIPTIPLWMLLSSILPKEWDSYQVYFGIVVVLSFIGWTGLARTIRGLILARRETQYILAARNLGANTWRLIMIHLMPNIMSYLLVNVTLSIPAMIIGETSLSFLGLGIRPPMTSWGAMLSEAQNLNNVVNNPWYLIPAIFVILSVLSYNFVGDGARDAADPFSRR